MVWDYSEANPLSASSGNFTGQVTYLANVVDALPKSKIKPGLAEQIDASSIDYGTNPIVSTDPPYYDNIGYADLSDFFYVWLRRSLKSIYPTLFATHTTPKAQELIATPHRHGSAEAAEEFFLDGMSRVLERLRHNAHPAFPVTIYYAYKQSERRGWETFLEAVIRSDLAITGTWPMRTENPHALKKQFAVLASSILLVCKPRTHIDSLVTRREFIAELHAVLSRAVQHLQSGNISPVDLAQAALGPGMSVYTRYAQLLIRVWLLVVHLCEKHASIR